MKIEKFNEFINNSSEILILIESAEMTNLSDPEAISNTESYRRVIQLGKSIIPILIERKSYIWNIALKELTGVNPIGNKSSDIIKFWLNWAKENGY